MANKSTFIVFRVDLLLTDQQPQAVRKRSRNRSKEDFKNGLQLRC